MPVAAVAIAAVGLGLSVYQTVDAKKREKEAKKAADEYERQKLTNPYENLKVSTLGSELQQEAINTQASSVLDSIRNGGSRAIMGGLPTLYDTIIRSNQQVAANLDQQEANNQQLTGQGNIIVQNMNEQRERDDLFGIGNEINNARQEYNQGLTDSMQSLTSLGSAAYNLKNGNGKTSKTMNNFATNKKSQNAIQNNLYNNNSQNTFQDNSYLKKIDDYNRMNRSLFRLRY